MRPKPDVHYSGLCVIIQFKLLLYVVRLATMFPSMSFLESLEINVCIKLRLLFNVFSLNNECMHRAQPFPVLQVTQVKIRF